MQHIIFVEICDPLRNNYKKIHFCNKWNSEKVLQSFQRFRNSIFKINLSTNKDLLSNVKLMIQKKYLRITENLFTQRKSRQKLICENNVKSQQCDLNYVPSGEDQCII